MPDVSSSADIGNAPADSASLDKAPPPPVMRKAQPTRLMGNGGGLGAAASSPQARALQGMQLVEQGSELITSVFPSLAPVLGDFIGRLHQSIPQALADMTQGGPGAGSFGAPAQSGMGATPVPGPPGAAAAPPQTALMGGPGVGP
jgi:hypothetical protein